MSARQRAILAVVVAGPLWTAAACTERVPLLTVDSIADAGEEPPGEDAGLALDTAGPADASPAPDSAADGPRCHEAPQSVRLDFQSPQVVIALDRSYSMFAHRPGGRSWWQAIKQELTTYLRENEGAVQFGYEEFPGRAACDQASGCCGSAVLVPPFLNSRWEIERHLKCESAANGCFMTSDHSPSGDALSRIRNFYSRDHDPERDRFVLLITDGSPSCGTDPGECEEAGRQAGKLFATGGIKTLVLALGPEARASTCLETVAVAGQTRGQGATDFPAVADPTQLEDQLAKVMAMVAERACRFTLRSDPRGREKMTVTVDYMPLPRDPTHKEGWDFDPPGAPEIQLYGSACTRLKDAEIEHRAVRAQMACMQCGSQINCQ